MKTSNVLSVKEFKEQQSKKKSKYRNTRVTYNGIQFDSKKELSRYLVLKDMEDRGEISKLELQPPFSIYINGVRICLYKADFCYYNNNTCKRVVEDTKGFRTEVYKLKKKMVEAYYGFEIIET